MKNLATKICSMSDAFFLMSFQMSIVNMVVAELKVDVKEDTKADIITASINPPNPAIF